MSAHKGPDLLLPAHSISFTTLELWVFGELAEILGGSGPNESNLLIKDQTAGIKRMRGLRSFSRFGGI